VGYFKHPTQAWLIMSVVVVLFVSLVVVLIHFVEQIWR